MKTGNCLYLTAAWINFQKKLITIKKMWQHAKGNQIGILQG